LKKLAEAKEVIPAKNAVHLTIISTFGVKLNKYSSIVLNCALLKITPEITSSVTAV